MESRPPPPKPFLRHARIRNYKSISKCDVALQSLTVLVGRNGAGKSNFLDALRFVSDGLQTSLDHAIKARGGMDSVRRRSTGHPRNFAIELEAILPDWSICQYGFEVASRTKGGFAIKQETLRLRDTAGMVVAFYKVDEGNLVEASESAMPPAVPDRLYLVNASGLPKFRAAFDHFSAMGFYNLNPDVMKELQSPDSGELLHRDGSNISSVVSRLEQDRPQVLARIGTYLTRIVPGISGVSRIALGPKETLEFRHEVEGLEQPLRFYAANVSDGTLRALGILAAVMQLAGRSKPVPVVGIEEPETALHPAAAGALMDALSEAAEHTQVLITSHSGDLLDQVDVERHGLLSVVSRQGKTEIAQIDEASRTAIREHLYTAGDLHRMDQIEPDPEDLRRQEQLPLFDVADDDER
jgi:predicted ATPase